MTYRQTDRAAVAYTVLCIASCGITMWADKFVLNINMIVSVINRLFVIYCQ